MIRKKRGFSGERYLLVPVKHYPELINHPLVNSNYITEIGYFPTASYHYTERKHGAEENILIFCIAGQGTIILENKKQFMLKRGDVFTIRSHQAHCYYADGQQPWSIMWFHFATATWQSFQPLIKAEVVHLSNEKQNRIENHFIELFTMMDQKISLGNLICASNFLSLILTECYFMDNTPYKKNQQNNYLQTGINYMNEHIDDQIQLDECAKAVGISVSYLNQIFKRFTQKSPVDYFIRLKMEKACNLLALTNLKIYEIAEELGYHDQFYFSKVFRKNIGQAPKVFRESAGRVRKSL